MNNSSSQVVQPRDPLPSDVSGEITDSLGRMVNELTEVAQDWSSKARSAAKTTDAFVRSSPWQALGVVALVGIAVGVLASRQTRQARLRRQAEAIQHEMAGG